VMPSRAATAAASCMCVSDILRMQGMLQALIQEQNQIMVSWQRIWGGGCSTHPAVIAHTPLPGHTNSFVSSGPHTSVAVCGCLRLQGTPSSLTCCQGSNMCMLQQAQRRQVHRLPEVTASSTQL
jgi:hypothetical protein